MKTTKVAITCITTPKESAMFQNKSLSYILVAIATLTLALAACGGGGSPDPITCPTGQHISNGTCVPDTVVDTTPPTVAFVAPTGGATITANSVTITANATDASGVRSVTFKVDGSVVGNCSGSGPQYTYSWTAPTEQNVNHTLEVCATDNSSPGNTDCDVVNVMVNNMPPDACTTWRSDFADRTLKFLEGDGVHQFLMHIVLTDQGGTCMAAAYVDSLGGNAAVAPASSMTYTSPPEPFSSFSMPSSAYPSGRMECVFF